MTATVLSYNSVSVTHVKMREMSAEAVLDDSQTVQIGVRKTLTLSGLIQNENSADYVSNLKAMEADLLVPRQRLTITVNGETWIDVYPTGSGGTPGSNPSLIVDINNGPTPIRATVQDVIGGRASRVAMVIQWTEPPESDTLTTDPVILAHRFQTRTTIGDNELGTRVTDGTVIFNGKFTNVNPDAWRQYVVPRETAGWRRESLEFVVDGAQRTLAYRCVEVEGYRPFPQGILKAEGTATVTRAGGEGAMRKSVQFRLEADKHYPKDSLVERAFDVLGSRVDLTGTDEQVISLSLTEDLWGSNSIQVSCDAIGGGGDDGRRSRFDLNATSLFTQVGSVLSTLESNGRFRQLNTYGQSMVYSAVQAIFNAPTDGSPTRPDDITEADVERWTPKASFLTDSDGDGYAENFVQLLDTDRVDVVAAELPDDYDGTALDIFIGPNTTTDFLTEEAAGPNAYVKVETRKARHVRPNYTTSPTADPTKPDRVYQGTPEVIEVHEGEMWRVGAQPEFFVPAELAEATRTSILLAQDVYPLTPKPMANGSTIEYGVGYRYVLQRLYNPSAGDWDSSKSVTFDAFGSSTIIEFAAGDSVDAPHQPIIASATTIAAVDPSLPGAVYG
jgi:hypothetical protein